MKTRKMVHQKHLLTRLVFCRNLRSTPYSLFRPVALTLRLKILSHEGKVVVRLTMIEVGYNLQSILLRDGRVSNGGNWTVIFHVLLLLFW